MSNNFEEAPLFSLFWENSKLNKQTARQLLIKLDRDAHISSNMPQLYYPTEDNVLKKPTDYLAKIMRRRKSTRSFADTPITEKHLGSLLYGFSQDSNRRLLPSAGAKYPIEVYGLLFNIKGNLNKNIIYYSPDNHSVSRVGSCPPWEEFEVVMGTNLDGAPAAVFIFVGAPDRVVKKYGERGGRFVLIEAGHYAQNLGLRLIKEGLAGVELGGLYDDDVKKLLKLEKAQVIVSLGYAVGFEKIK